MHKNPSLQSSAFTVVFVGLSVVVSLWEWAWWALADELDGTVVVDDDDELELSVDDEVEEEDGVVVLEVSVAIAAVKNFKFY